MINRKTSYALVTLLVAAAAVSAHGQQQSPAQAPVKGMASTVGLYTYPEKKQSAQQQLTDEQQCYNNAKSQTGFDPNAVTTAPAQSASGGKDHGAAKGAATGAVLAGATGGDAGQGAARGAVIGGVRAKRKQKKAEEKAEKQDDANKEALEKQQGDFKRAMSACLGARGYSVK